MCSCVYVLPSHSCSVYYAVESPWLLPLCIIVLLPDCSSVWSTQAISFGSYSGPNPWAGQSNIRRGTKGIHSHYVSVSLLDASSVLLVCIPVTCSPMCCVWWGWHWRPTSWTRQRLSPAGCHSWSTGRYDGKRTSGSWHLPVSCLMMDAGSWDLFGRCPCLSVHCMPVCLPVHLSAGWQGVLHFIGMPDLLPLSECSCCAGILCWMRLTAC